MPLFSRQMRRVDPVNSGWPLPLKDCLAGFIWCHADFSPKATPCITKLCNDRNLEKGDGGHRAATPVQVLRVGELFVFRRSPTFRSSYRLS